MIKELTPLRALKEIGKLKDNGCYVNTTVEYNIIETFLKKYSTIEQHLIKRGFDNLEDFLKQLSEYVDISEKEHERLMMLESPSYQTLKREYDFGVEHYNELLNQYNKEHKALEIIKKYANKDGVHIDFNKVMRATVKNFDYTTMTYTVDEELIKEYELLKEVLL